MIATPQGGNDNKFAYGLDSNGKLLRKKVPVEGIDYKGRFGATTISGTEHEVSIGEKYFVCEDDGRDSFRVGDDVLISSRSDINCYMWGEIIGKDTVNEPMRLRVFIDDISPWTSTVNDWILQVVARPKPGIEKDTSLTSFDPTDGGPWTLTVTADKFFPIGGTLLIKPTADRSVALIGEVKAYSGTSLTVSLRSTNATVSQSYDSWSIALLDSPPAKMPLLSITGLTIDATGTLNTFIISPGEVMDSTGTVLLKLTDPLSKLYNTDWAVGDGNGGTLRVLLPGTFSAAGTPTINGTGTSFTTDFAQFASLNDFQNSGGAGSGVEGNIFSNDASGSSRVASVTDDDTMTTAGAFTATNSTYYRNGFTGWKYVALIRRDSDGLIDAAAVTTTVSGEPDLPPGYSYYRIIGRFEVNSGGTVTKPAHMHIHNNQPFAPSTVGFLTYGATLPASLSRSYIVQDSSTVAVASATPGSVFTLAVVDDSVGNTKLANMAAYTLKGRNAGTSGDPSDIDITALTTKASPTTGDYVLITDGADSNAFKKADVSTFSGGSGVGANYADYGLITDTPSSSVDYGTIV